MELTNYETSMLQTILEDLVNSTDVHEEQGAYIINNRTWLTPNECYMIRELIKKCRISLYNSDTTTKEMRKISKGVHEAK